MLLTKPFCNNHFAIYTCQVITLYTLHLHNIICELYLKEKTLSFGCMEEMEKDEENGDPERFR